MDISGNNVSIRPAYTALSSQLARIQPSPTLIGEYTPTNTAAPTCGKLIFKDAWDPTKNSTRTVEVSPKLPARPYRRLCSCMMERLRCVADPDISPDQARAVITQICGADKSACPGLMSHPASGTYGAFKGCNTTERVSWALTKHLDMQNNDSAACSAVDGHYQQPKTSPSQDGECETLLRQTKPEGTGLVTFTPVAMSKNGKMGNLTDGNDLTSAAKAGIGIGITLIILVITVVVVFIRHWKKQKAKSMLGSNDELGKAELEGTSISRDGSGPVFLDGLEKTELEAHETVEMGNGRERFELPVGAQHELYELESPVEETKR